MNKYFGTILLAITSFVVMPVTSFAQVFGSGPSDPLLFTNGVFNLPGDVDPGKLGNLQQLNLADGGNVAGSFEANSGSEVNISGGSFGSVDDFNSFSSFTNSEVNISGGNLFDFVDFSNSEVNISGGTVRGPSQALSGSVVNVSGGTVGSCFFVVGSEVNVSDGAVGQAFNVIDGSAANISGGTFAEGFSVSSGSEVNISGGTFADEISFNGSEGNISGGTFGNEFVLGGSEVSISGGTFGDAFSVFGDSTLNLVGIEFFLDGEPLETLAVGESLTISERDSTLSGLLTDGLAFSFDLNSERAFPFDQDFFDPDATLTVTLVASVPEPNSLVLLAGSSLLVCLRRRRC